MKKKNVKKLTVKQMLKNSYVITIDDRQHGIFNQLFKHYGLTPLPKKFQGIQDKRFNGATNCYMSHRALIQMAKEKDLPFITIFEDDAYPRSNVMADLEVVLSNIPSDCKVLIMGYIYNFQDDTQERNILFYDAFKGYGAHAYILFKEGYDDYLQILDKFQQGDGVFYTGWGEREKIGKETIIAPIRPLFIQYNVGKGNINLTGPTYYKDVKFSEKGTTMVKWHPVDVVKKGFPRIEDVLQKTFNTKGLHDPLTFVTVNAGTNTFTNITVKSILRHHPNAKVFIVDVPRTPDKKFVPIEDDIMRNVEVMRGICWDEMKLPTIDIDEVKNITDDEREEVVRKFRGLRKIPVLPTVDYNHCFNIQLALDTLDENFVLIDSDAPLLGPANTICSDSWVTSTSSEYQLYRDCDDLGALIRPQNPKYRYSPYIQWMNVKMIKENGIRYFDIEMMKDNLDQASFGTVSKTDSRLTIFFLTGCFFKIQCEAMGLPVNEITQSYFVDHFAQASWGTPSERNAAFINKWKGLFKNPSLVEGNLT